LKKFKSFKKKTIVSATLALGLIIPQAMPAITYAEVMDQDIVNLRIIETTDIHANVMNYDYYKNGVSSAFGLTKAATLINQARAEVKNSLLFDNGDTIQGSPIGDYVVNKNLMTEGYVHPVIRAMNLMNYDAQTVGNHEFNYGLDFMNETLNDAKHPIVNANVYDAATNKPYFNNGKQFEILTREVEDADGEKHTIKVGVTGFVPPDIMKWDAKHLEGKLVVKDIIESANEVIPQMKAAGADVIVVLAHSGIADYDQNGQLKQYATGAENAGYYLSQVAGIDAILTGHQHLQFPNAAKPSFKDGNGIDNTKGTINGVPTLMPGNWGNNIGLIDLTIELVDGKWVVKDGGASLRSITTGTVETNKAMEEAVKAEHDATILYMNETVGQLTGNMNTYFSLVKDNASMEIVNRAQTWYIEKALKGTEYANLPILSAAAPFKAGRGSADNYTNVEAGNITIRNIADLYLYDNNVVHALKVNGSDIKEWLEWSAGQFNQIDPGKKEPQNIINTNFPTYNYDVIDGVTYQVDVTQPSKYDKDGKVINADANRIKKLMFNGKEVTPEMEFIVATNDYRSAGVFFNKGMAKTIFKAPDSNRQVVSDYVAEKKVIEAEVNNNWSFKPINSGVTVTFPSNVKGADFLSGYPDITYTKQVDSSGFGIYQLDMSKKVKFADVKENFWAKEYIEALASEGIILGKTETTFDPDGKITRGQFTSLLVRSLGLKGSATKEFTDVKGDAELAANVSAAFEAGITTGVTASTFEPNKPITREQMVAMLIRAYNVKTGSEFKATKTADYTDAKKVSAQFADYVNAATELEFVSGTNGSFNPKGTANRAQAAKVVFNLLKK
jgi:2',3'-cyclic-nucleotide 2'-phosphodiesterase / 3'-nucleotidase